MYTNVNEQQLLQIVTGQQLQGSNNPQDNNNAHDTTTVKYNVFRCLVFFPTAPKSVTCGRKLSIKQVQI